MSKSDQDLIDKFLQQSDFNSNAVLIAIGINEERINKIKQSKETLHFAERILLEIIKNNPQVLNTQSIPNYDAFSAVAREKLIIEVDAQIEDLLQEMRRSHAKSNLSIDVFMNENNKNNARREKIKHYFLSLCERDQIQEHAYKNYITSFWRAFEHNIPFKRSLFNDPQLRSKY